MVSKQRIKLLVYHTHNLSFLVLTTIPSVAAYLISKDQTKMMRRGKENDKDELMCFDDLYLSSRTGIVSINLIF